MAVNVFLIVHHSYDIESLRRLEWKYMAGITTVTFVPAFVLLFIRDDDNGPMYGSVTVARCMRTSSPLQRLHEIDSPDGQIGSIFAREPRAHAALAAGFSCA